jgi:hypothetical protein
LWRRAQRRRGRRGDGLPLPGSPVSQEFSRLRARRWGIVGARCRPAIWLRSGRPGMIPSISCGSGSLDCGLVGWAGRGETAGRGHPA